MSKKIKILVVACIFILLIFITNNSLAYTKTLHSNNGLSASRYDIHYDTWSGRDELMAQNRQDGNAVGATICIQRGAALRYTPEGYNTTYYRTQTVHSSTECGVSDSNNVVDRYGTFSQDFESAIRNNLSAIITNFEGSEANQGTRIWATYGGNSETYRYQEKQLYTPIEDGEIVATSRPYTIEQQFTPVSSSTSINTLRSYILSAGKDYAPITSPEFSELKQGNYAGTVSDIADTQLIQDTVWASPINININYRPQLAPEATALLNEAIAYENLVPQLQNYSQNTSLIDNNAQVIVNRNTNKYIIGPYKINYLNDTRFSYIQDIYLIDENGNKIEATIRIINSENNSTYPISGQSFFIEFDKEVGLQYNKVGIKVELAYLYSTQESETEYSGSGNIYQLVGILSTRSGSHTYSVIIQEVEYGWREVWENGQPVYDENGNIKVEWGEIRPEIKEYRTCSTKTYIGRVTPYRIGEYSSQELITIDSATREWREHELQTTNNFLDLRINLGGYVWVDDETGKESVSNGLYDSQDVNDKRVKNVTVTLYKDDGTQVASTTTNENGEYRFTGLNAMYKYYVKFTYNGQYYEPTTYTSPNDANNGWGRGNWQNNSNATDKINEREAFNQKFASIGSSPSNYSGGQTYTREQLLNNHIIDEFGNVISNDDNNPMTRFAKDCRMNAYTKSSDSNSYDLYPAPNIFVISNTPVVDRELLGTQPNLLYDAAYYINLGLKPRQDADIAIKKDISKVTLEINNQTHEYTYDTLENKENAENQWDIGVRLSDAYYNTKYSRELYQSDYLYKASNYGNEEVQQTLGKSKQDELEVYVTYKIMVRNQSLSIRTRIDEIVDYYDEDYEYVDERSYIKILRGTNEGTYKVNVSEQSRYGANTQTDIEGYDAIYVQGLSENAQKIDETGANVGNQITDGIYLNGGQTAYIYLTFKVRKDENNGENWVKLDEEIQSGVAIGVGKENIVEVNGYSSIYADGTQVPNIGDVGGKPAGIIDRDSTPGNLDPQYVPKDGEIQHDKFEDDTDKSPNIRIILNRDDDATRVISGSAWEDERTKEIGVATIGDGARNEDEKPINGVTVQLVELMENGQEFVWREFGSDITGPSSIGNGTGTGTKQQETPIINAFNLVQNYQFGENKDGAYAFKSFVPGKYVVRFIYGDTVKTVTPTSLNVGGLNQKSYNGQDYKSTTYQQGIMQHIVNEQNEVQEAYKTYAWRKASTFVNGQEILGDILTTVSAFKDDSSNNETANAATNQPKAYLYDITASDAKNNVSDAKDIESRRNEVVNYSKEDVTNYIAEVLASHKSDYATMNDRNQLLNDLMQNTKMVAETGLIVVEFEYDREQTPNQVENNTQAYKITNVDLGLEERAKSQLVINKEVTNVKLTLADGSILFDAKATASNVLWRDHKAYSVGYTDNFMDESKFSNIENIRNRNSSKFGLIQLSMDEELMHGATIKITYNVTVSNIGEVDYKENSFYYTGNVQDVRNVVTTKADKVIDYVANNLQFYAKDNSNWKVITKDEISSQGLVNSALNKEIEKYNTIIVTEDFDRELVPNLYKTKVNRNAQDSASVPLVLTQLITAENDSDDLTYRNIVEIVQTSNTVGRRQEYSVVGNQNPTKEPQELDTDKAEVVKILPPFGNVGLYVIIAITTIIAVAILVVGIIFIKKKVLRKK